MFADMAAKFEVEDLRLPSELFDQTSSFERQMEEEDYMAGLTRQMARSFLQDDAAAAAAENFGAEAGEANMGVQATETMPCCQGRKTGAGGYFANPFLARQHLHRLQAARIFEMRQQHLFAAREMRSSARSGASPPVARHPCVPGVGMRTVFLHSSGARRESIGTGVFLPRTAASKAEPKSKTACSTVLIPARVAQALNIDSRTSFPSGFVLENDSFADRRKPESAAMATSLSCLPQEWTY